MFTTFDIIESGLVGSNHTSTCTTLDTHVANSHTLLHRKVTDRLTGKLNKMSSSTRSRNFRDDIQNNILGGNTLFTFTIHGNAHGFGFGLEDTLRSKYHLHLRSSDTESNRTKCTVSRGMAISTHNRHTGLCKTLLRTDNVYDTMTWISQREIFNSVLFAVTTERFKLIATLLLSHW